MHLRHLLTVAGAARVGSIEELRVSRLTAPEDSGASTKTPTLYVEHHQLAISDAMRGAGGVERGLFEGHAGAHGAQQPDGAGMADQQRLRMAGLAQIAEEGGHALRDLEHAFGAAWAVVEQVGAPGVHFIAW